MRAQQHALPCICDGKTEHACMHVCMFLPAACLLHIYMYIYIIHLRAVRSRARVRVLLMQPSSSSSCRSNLWPRNVVRLKIFQFLCVSRESGTRRHVYVCIYGSYVRVCVYLCMSMRRTSVLGTVPLYNMQHAQAHLMRTAHQRIFGAQILHVNVCLRLNVRFEWYL